MGTLFDQAPRQDYLGGMAITWLIGVMERHDFDPKKRDDVHAFCDLMRTALAIQNADALDEQLGGFGDILKGLVAALEGLTASFDQQ